MSIFFADLISPACETPDDTSAEVGALPGVLVASGVILLPADRGQCNDGESTGIG